LKFLKDEATGRTPKEHMIHGSVESDGSRRRRDNWVRSRSSQHLSGAFDAGGKLSGPRACRISLLQHDPRRCVRDDPEVIQESEFCVNCGSTQEPDVGEASPARLRMGDLVDFISCHPGSRSGIKKEV
jgi:hypothetical protein